MPSEDISAHHTPAVKVGGRRLSVSKHRSPIVEHATLVDDNEQTGEVSTIDDYPRPAPPGEDQPHAPPHHEEDPLKKDKHVRHNDRLHNKLEATRPTKDVQSNNKGYGAGGRIVQPSGKSFGA
ncbi:hypothetical protein ONZ45_g2349 [Pleurotus djamor]|nr:hypothetical protein ONZ45_g19587 [Pleurotus djamor]KAJ8520830.1 hypothetical protein ONZ45_g2349 [Pleurotus djamor]